MSVEPADTILKVRQKISQEIHRGLHKFSLVLDHEVLEDTYTLDDCGIQDSTILFLAFKSPDESTITARLHDGRTFTIGFRFTDPVQKLRRLISEKAFGRRLPLSLTYQGQPLDDLKTLREAGIIGHSEVFVKLV